MNDLWDVIVVGAGPAGSAVAIPLARAGHRVLLLERSIFPRDKVCGDCLNPDCWPVFERLGVAEAVRSLRHASLRRVEFESARGRRFGFEFPPGPAQEIAVRRSVLDAALVAEAVAAGAEFQPGNAVEQVVRESGGGWSVVAGGPAIRGRFLVAADGRNSTVVRLVGLSDATERDERIGLHAHVSLPDELRETVRMFWRPEGYGGFAPVDRETLNVSIAGRAAGLPALKAWVRAELGLTTEPLWRTIAPLDRAPRLAAPAEGLFLAGDAALVVEPFTGEGIYYALASGELIARTLGALLRGELEPAEALGRTNDDQSSLYRGRLWVNRLARWIGRRPRLAEILLGISRHYPGLLRALVTKVVAGSAVRSSPGL